MTRLNTLFTLPLVGLVAASEGMIPHATDNVTRFVFSFGDSYTQTGKSSTLSSIQPHLTLPSHPPGFNFRDIQPSPSNIFGNPVFPGDTTDNGANWVGVLIENLAPNITLSYNFAAAGNKPSRQSKSVN